MLTWFFSRGQPQLGLKSDVYRKLAEEVDVVIHNGAQVHWVYVPSLLFLAPLNGCPTWLDQ